MVGGSAPLAHTAVAQPLFNESVGNLDVQHLVDLHTHLVQRLGLGQGAGKAVQDEAVFAVLLGQPLPHDAVDHLVGDQATLVDDSLCLLPQGGAGLDGLPQDDAGGDGGDIQALPDDFTLGALPRAGGS